MITFKRFFAFEGDVYYPDRGMANFIGDFDTVEEAKNAVAALPEPRSSRWWVVWDAEIRSNAAEHPRTKESGNDSV